MKKQTHNHPLGFLARQRFFLGAAALLLAAAGARAQSVSTVISNNVFEPNSVATDPNQNAYLTDSSDNIILKLVPSTGAISLYAGSGLPAYADGPGVEADFFQPMGIVYARGGLAVVDQGNQLIRFITIESDYGIVSTLAGVAGTTGSNNGPGIKAEFNYPSGIAVDAGSNLYVADQGNNVIRKIDTANNVTDVVITNGYVFLQPTGVAVDNNSNIWVSDTGNQVIVLISNQSAYVVAGVPGVSGYGDSTLGGAFFSVPTGILWDNANNQLLVADTGNDVIRSIFVTNVYGAPAYIVETVAGIPGLAGSVDGLPDVAEFDAPVGVALDPFNFGYYVVDRDGFGGSPLDVFESGALRVFQSTTPLPTPPAPVFGFVVFTSPGSGLPAVTQFTATSQAVFNNDTIIAVEAQANTQTFLTFGPTGSAIPAPGPDSGSSPQTYEGDNQTTAAPSIITPAPDTTLFAVSEGPSGELSPIATARFQFITANPTITGLNAADLILSDNTANATIYYTLEIGPASCPKCATIIRQYR